MNFLKSCLPMLCLGLLWTGCPMAAQTFTFQGKATAKIQRAVTVPFHLRVEEVLVDIGDTVTRDAPLLRYAMLPQDARSWQNALSGQNLAQISTRQQLASTDQEIMTAGSNARRDKALAQEGLAPKAELNRSNAAVSALGMRRKQLNAQLAHNRREYALLLEEANSYFGSKLKPGDGLPKEMRLLATVDGTIIDMHGAARVGGLVPPGQPVFTLACLDPIQAEVQVHETEISRLKKGDAVLIEAPGLPGQKFSGKITSLSWTAMDMNIAMPSFYIIVVDIENPDRILRPGYKVNATITVD